MTPISAGLAKPVGATLSSSQMRLSINPGEQNDMTLNVANHAPEADQFRLSVTGMPSTWLTVPEEWVALAPGGEALLEVAIHPPRQPNTRAGIYQVKFDLLSKSGRVAGLTTVVVEVRPCEALSFDLTPKRLRNFTGGTLTVKIENNGNSETDYSLEVSQESDLWELQVEPSMGTITPQSQQHGQIRIQPRRRKWQIGQRRTSRLKVDLKSSKRSTNVEVVFE